MDGTGRIVLLNRSPGRAGGCDQAVGMVESYHRIILAVNEEARWRRAPGRAQCLLDAMVSDRPVRARHQPTVMARVKQELSPSNVRRVSQRIRVRIIRAGLCHPAVSASRIWVMITRTISSRRA